MNVANPQQSNVGRNPPRYLEPPDVNNMIYKPLSHNYQSGNGRLLAAGYSLPPEQPHHISGMNHLHHHQAGGVVYQQQQHHQQQHHQFPGSLTRQYVSPHQYDNVGGHHLNSVHSNGSSSSRQQYQQRLNEWSTSSQQQQQQHQHHAYANVTYHHHQSFCGQTNESSKFNGLQQQTQSDPSCSWTIRNAVRQSPQKPQEPSYHQINNHASSERDNYLLHQPSNNQCETSLSKRRVSCDNSSPIYDQMPATPYSS